MYEIDWTAIDELIDDTPDAFRTHSEWVAELRDSCFVLPEFRDLPLIIVKEGNMGN